jgi:hypothetical protein
MPKTILGGVENRVGEKTYVYQEDEHSNKQNLNFCCIEWLTKEFLFAFQGLIEIMDDFLSQFVLFSFSPLSRNEEKGATRKLMISFVF